MEEEARNGYASISLDADPANDNSPSQEGEEVQHERPAPLPPQQSCRRQWLVRIVSVGVFLGLLLVAAVAMDIFESSSSRPQQQSHLRQGSGPPSGGRALLWSVPWLKSVSNGMCEGLEKVNLHVCPTTTTTTTTTATTTSQTETTTSATTKTSTTSSTTTTTKTTTVTSTKTTTSTTTGTTSTTTTTTTLHPLWPWPSTLSGKDKKRVVKGISYAPVPIKHPGGMMPDDDFMSANTSAFWGPHSHSFEGPGRKDLEIMRSLGANTVRLYGNDPALDHSGFLDEAHKNGLQVVAGLSDYPYVQMPGNCMRTGYNCYEHIKHQYGQNLKNGFLASKGTYHSALRSVILMNEPDLKFEGGVSGFPGPPAHWSKALISAFDAVLSAEQEAAVEGLAPNFTVAFSFGRCKRCSHYQDYPSLGQMWELRHAMQHPHTVNYTARNDLWWAYQRRFVNSFNTQNSASELSHLFLDEYDRGFQGTPVFIGEYHSPLVTDLEQDLGQILKMAASSSTMLMGISFFEFQVRFDKGGGEMSFGMFGLSDTYKVSDEKIASRKFTSWCLEAVRAKHMNAKCGHTQTDVDYVIESKWHRKMDHMPTAALCCEQCQQHPECHAWTWVRDAGLSGCPSQCWLKGAGAVRKEAKKGVVSGLLHSSERDAIAYVHTSLVKAYGGPGVTEKQLCPTAPVTTTLTSTVRRTTTSAKISSKDSSDKTELLVSASWVGCFKRKLGLVKDGRSWGHSLSTTSCARTCRSHKYMLLRGSDRCACDDGKPPALEYSHEDDEACTNTCDDGSGKASKGYCGDEAHYAVYSIKVTSEKTE